MDFKSSKAFVFLIAPAFMMLLASCSTKNYLSKRSVVIKVGNPNQTPAEASGAAIEMHQIAFISEPNSSLSVSTASPSVAALFLAQDGGSEQPPTSLSFDSKGLAYAANYPFTSTTLSGPGPGKVWFVKISDPTIGKIPLVALFPNQMSVVVATLDLGGISQTDLLPALHEQTKEAYERLLKCATNGAALTGCLGE